jgi:UDP-N-acetylglucosamine 2-epimerase (non-hydrolysing)
VGTSQKKIVSEVSKLLTDKKYYRRMANAVNPYGDGRAAGRILQAIQWYFGLRKEKPSLFGRGR